MQRAHGCLRARAVNVMPHPLAIEVREYQSAIAKSALESNTLVVLPTGLGKTVVALLVAVERLSMFPDGKVLVLAPTRPLVLQHARFFKEHLASDAISACSNQLRSVRSTILTHRNENCSFSSRLTSCSTGSHLLHVLSSCRSQ